MPRWSAELVAMELSNCAEKDLVLAAAQKASVCATADLGVAKRQLEAATVANERAFCNMAQALANVDYAKRRLRSAEDCLGNAWELDALKAKGGCMG
jgi:hypothetical protein